MKNSIRRRLIVILLVFFIATWLVVTIAAYKEATHETGELFNAQLSQMAGLLEKFASNLSDNGNDVNTLTRSIYGHSYERHVAFQIWRGEQIIIRSKNAPDTRLSVQPGFSDILRDNLRWRVFMLETPESDYTVYTAESYKARNELISHITRDALLPLPLGVPIMLILVWVAVGRGLSPLTRVANEIRQRRADLLTPLETDNTPYEVLPLINSINHLLSRLGNSLEKERRFTADAAHELRTPLAGIRAQSQVALRSRDENERRQALQNIIEAVDHGSHLIQQMLLLAQLEPENLSPVLKTIDLDEFITDIIQSNRDIAEQSGVQLDFTPTAGRCMTIRGDTNLLTILLRNLIDNAIRYIGTGNMVRLSVSAGEDGISLSVCDNGPGIPDTERQRVLERFYRPAGQQRYGSGLGLSIATRIVELHKATIQLLDNPPHGLCVKVLFAEAAADP